MMAEIEELRKELAQLIVENGRIIFELDDVEEKISIIKDRIKKLEEEG